MLIKAVHGGGGKGIQVVESPDRFHELFQRVSAEARAAFGNGDVYLEKYVTSLRHIEAQLLRDHAGNTRVLGLRDCSVQRDKQKVIEESGSTALPEPLVREVMKHTAALACEVGYVGAGTVEFIYDVDAGEVYFMEMNTRLQVEHPYRAGLGWTSSASSSASRRRDLAPSKWAGTLCDRGPHQRGRVAAGPAGGCPSAEPRAPSDLQLPEAEHIDSSARAARAASSPRTTAALIAR